MNQYSPERMKATMKELMKRLGYRSVFCDQNPHGCNNHIHSSPLHHNEEIEWRRHNYEKLLPEVTAELELARVKEESERRPIVYPEDKFFNRLRSQAPEKPKWYKDPIFTSKKYPEYEEKPAQLLYDLPQPEIFPPGAIFIAKVSHIVSPSKFYIYPFLNVECGCDTLWHEGYRDPTGRNTYDWLLSKEGKDTDERYYEYENYQDIGRRDKDAEDVYLKVTKQKIIDQSRLESWDDPINVIRRNLDLEGDGNKILSEKEKQKNKYFPPAPQGYFKMVQELTKFFDTLDGKKILPYKSHSGYQINELVAVYLRFDPLPIEGLLHGNIKRQAWLRGFVSKILDYGNSYEVKLIDHGPKVTVQDEFMLRLPKEFMNDGPFVTKGQLFGIHPIYENWSKNATSLFKELVDDRFMLVTVAPKGVFLERKVNDKYITKLPIFMVDYNSKEYKNIGIELDKSGKAVLVSPFPQADFLSKMFTQDDLWNFRAFHNEHATLQLNPPTKWVDPKKFEEDRKEKRRNLDYMFHHRGGFKAPINPPN